MVQLSPEAADAVQAKRPPASLQEAQEQLRSSGFSLEPLYAGTEDDVLASWFRVSVGDVETAEQIAEILRSTPDVQSAYVEPPSEAPG